MAPRRRRGFGAVLTALAALAAAAGGFPPKIPCPEDRPPPREWARSPETAFDFFRECLRCGHYGLAYRMLAEPARRETSEDEFVVLFRESPDHYRAVVDCKKYGDLGPAATEDERILTIRHPTGVRRRIRLIRENGIWTLDDSAEAFRAFVSEVIRKGRSAGR